MLVTTTSRIFLILTYFVRCNEFCIRLPSVVRVILDARRDWQKASRNREHSRGTLAALFYGLVDREEIDDSSSFYFKV